MVSHTVCGHSTAAKLIMEINKLVWIHFGADADKSIVWNAFLCAMVCLSFANELLLCIFPLLSYPKSAQSIVS